MVQINSDGNKIKENKYKILRMSLLLGNGDDRAETINNFEDAAREIDAMNDEVYLKDLDEKLYDTFKLEDEEKKLSNLVDYIGGRVEQRMSLIEDFSNVTGYDLVNLPIIKYQDRLDEYKSRLRYIREYLSNADKINILNDEISNLENKLNDSYVKKSKSEEKNLKSEEELFTRFKNIVSHIDLFKDVTEENIDFKLNEIVSVTEDSKKSLDIFNKSFSTLNQAGISGEERNEYLSYVNGAKEVFYANKEKEYLLRMYALLSNKLSEYTEIFSKRESLNNLIVERINLRKELGIDDNDILNSLYDLIDRQYNEIKEERINLDNIDNYIRDIDSRKIEVSDLEQDNQKVEILSLLKEYCIIDTYGEDDKDDTVVDTDEIANSIESFENGNDDITPSLDVENVLKDTSATEVEKDENDDIFANVSLNIPSVTDENVGENEAVSEEVPVVDNDSLNDNDVTIEDNDVSLEQDSNDNVESSSLDITNAKENQVVSIDDAGNMDIKLATSKSNSVMVRVGEMLGVKAEKNNNIEKTSNEDKVAEVSIDNTTVNNSSAIENEVSSSLDNNSNDIFDNSNYDADPEENEGNNQELNMGDNPLFNNELSNSTLDDVMANNNVSDSTVDNDFWFSNDEAPLDLNSLPDLTDENNAFFDTNQNNNNLPNLEFPDLDSSSLKNEEDK